MEKPWVLLLDDDPAMLEALSLDLEPEFDVECAATMSEAVKEIKAAKGAVDVAVVDMKLGDDWEGGLKAIQEMLTLDAPPEIIVLTAYGSQENTIKCMEAGAFSYVEKSGRNVDGKVTGLLIATIHRALETHELKREKEEMAVRYVSGFTQCLAATIDSHSPYPSTHSPNVAKCARIIAEECGLSEGKCDDIEIAGHIHDLGMIGIDINVLTRSGPLTNIEWAMIREHPREAERILKCIPELSHLIPAIVDHHERYEGKGYPNGKKGDEISIGGRILAVADAFDAMLSDRPYQSRLSLDEAFHAIATPNSPRHQPGQFDPIVVEAFKRAFDRICRELYDPYHFGEEHEQELTIVFSDIVGSTSITAEKGDLRYKQIREKYRRLTENQVRVHKGHVVKYTGDGFLAAFHEAPKAVNFAIALQESLKRDRILDIHLQVRVGIHTARVITKKTLYGGDIFGPDVNLTVHLEGKAGAGEVILSDETYRCLPEQLAAYFKPSKPFSLKGFPEAINAWLK